jgi:glycosyltransferase involved in cell wall biosynthesis
MFSVLQGKDVTFFSPLKNALPRHVRIRFWPIRLLKQVGVSLWLALNVRRLIARHRLEALNIHSGPGGVLLLQRLPIPVIVTCHHTYWQQCHHLKSQFWKRIFLPFERRTYRVASRIVCVSDATRRTLIEHYGVAPEKTEVIYNAVDTGRFFPLGLPKDGRTIVYLGRIDKRKGIEFLIKSMPEVRRQVPQARLLVGGKGAYLERMKRLVQRLDLEQTVSFLGFVPETELNALYNRAQCAVVPSVFEGFGITVIEALAAGTRVVGSDADGIREILQGGAYGALAPYGDTRALAAAIVDELNTPRNPAALDPQYLAERFKEGYLQALQGASIR